MAEESKEVKENPKYLSFHSVARVHRSEGNLSDK